MKNLLVLLSIVSVFGFTSCQKETIEEMAPIEKTNLLEDQALITMQSLEEGSVYNEDENGTWIMIYVATECESNNGVYTNLSDYQYFLVSPEVYNECIEKLQTMDIVPSGHKVVNTPFGDVDSIVFYN